MRKNKGFTIVELTMVLVVIGILVTLYFNMDQIYFAARVKQETLKINRFENALMQYFLRSGVQEPPLVDPTPAPGNYEIDNRTFIDMGLLSEKDFEAPLAGGPWTFQYGYVDGANGWMQRPNIKSIGVELYDPSAVLPCIIEKSLDDLTMQDGRGRIVDDSDDFTEDEYKDCYSITADYDNMEYAFRIYSPRSAQESP